MVLNLLKSASLKGLVIALFLMPSFSHASYLWGSYPDVFPTPDEYCIWATTTIRTDWTFVRVDPHSESTKQCIGQHSSGSIQRYLYVNRTTGSCPENYTDDGTGQCIENPQCEILESKHWSVSDVRLAFEYVEIDGCYYVAQPSKLSCSIDYSSCNEIDCDTQCTYEVKPQSTAPSSNPPNEFGSETTQPQTTASSDERDTPSTASTDVSEPTVTTSPDGTVTTDETVVTQSTGSGSQKIWETDDFIFIQENDGSTTVKQKNVTTISNPDGSATVQESSTTSTTTASTETTTINKDLSTTPSTTVTGGNTIEGDTTTITYNYDSQGELTSTDTVSTDDTADTVDEEGTKIYTQSTITQGSFDSAMSSKLTELDEQKALLLSKFNEIKAEASNLVSFNSSGTGALPCPPPVMVEGFGEFDICVADYSDQLSIVASIIFFVAAFLSIAIILR